MCSAVSYFSTRVGSIIGADRLSFRVRDGSGRFPVAVVAVTLFFCGAGRRGVAGSAGVFGGGCGVWLWCVVAVVSFLVFDGCFVGCCKFSAG